MSNRTSKVGSFDISNWNLRNCQFLKVVSFLPFALLTLKVINWFKKTRPLDDLIEPNSIVAMWHIGFELGEGGDFKHQCWCGVPIFTW